MRMGPNQLNNDCPAGGFHSLEQISWETTGGPSYAGDGANYDTQKTVLRCAKCGMRRTIIEDADGWDVTEEPG
jgi:hypothetical protein